MKNKSAKGHLALQCRLFTLLHLKSATIGCSRDHTAPSRENICVISKIQARNPDKQLITSLCRK